MKGNLNPVSDINLYWLSTNIPPLSEQLLTEEVACLSRDKIELARETNFKDVQHNTLLDIRLRRHQKIICENCYVSKMTNFVIPKFYETTIRSMNTETKNIIQWYITKLQKICERF